jgi:septal ring factor EnvC (AmiA/AmiB activator)
MEIMTLQSDRKGKERIGIMNEVYYEMEPRLARVPKEKAKSTRRLPKWAVRTAAVLLWSALAAGTFALAYYYIGGILNQLERIQQTNQENIAELNKKLTELQTALNTNKEQAEVLKKQFGVVESELNAVKEEMSLAGDSLSSTAKTKQALNQRITDLSKELEELRKSIKKLEEAARVY